MTNTEKVKHIRGITLSPINKINDSLVKSNGDVDGAIKILLEQKQTSAQDMENRVANNSIVYSYVHNNKIGAMIVLSCQTDFVARNEIFIGLAKDICMHIVSSPQRAEFISKEEVPECKKEMVWNDAVRMSGNKPQEIQKKIAEGKLQKYYTENCLMNHKFIKNEEITVAQLIASVSGTLGEKIELRQFVKMTPPTGISVDDYKS